ncbi:MAG: 3-deoxy-manno-octulosonate cytidylyltransferase [Kiritimatiellae bacterium]|nr:3-deoxy-manno-octulosonate cytidylyltransferase [Kiritimatiellia bacterium]
MRAIGVIPARWQSTRFPGKSLAMLCGKPLLAWVIENARRARMLDGVIVATDDERIFRTATSCGVTAVMTRSDHPSGTDRVAEAVRDVDVEVVVNIQGDEPLLDPALVDRMVRALMARRDWDMVTAAAPITRPDLLAAPGVVKVVCDAEGRALYFSRSVIPFCRATGGIGELTLYRRHVGIYAYRKVFLERLVATAPCTLEKTESLEQLRALHIGGRILVLETREEGIGVDTPEDLEYVGRLISMRARTAASPEVSGGWREAEDQDR